MKLFFSFSLLTSSLFATLTTHSLPSTILNNQRTIHLYKGDEPPPNPYILILFDGESYLKEISALSILENLIRQKKIPPLYAVFVESLGEAVRDLELPCHPPFAEFILKELLPWIDANTGATRDRSKVILGGSSYGGLAAAYIAFLYPEFFGNVLSQSGSFWWSPGEKEEEWLIDRFAEKERIPLKFYLESGLYEGDDILLPNRRLSSLLSEKGYEVVYVETEGMHDSESWRKTFAQGITALIP